MPEGKANAVVLREQNVELAADLAKALKELTYLRSQQTTWKCVTWLSTTQGKSTVLATAGPHPADAARQQQPYRKPRDAFGHQGQPPPATTGSPYQASHLASKSKPPGGHVPLDMSPTIEPANSPPPQSHPTPEHEVVPLTTPSAYSNHPAQVTNPLPSLNDGDKAPCGEHCSDGELYRDLSGAKHRVSEPGVSGPEAESRSMLPGWQAQWDLHQSKLRTVLRLLTQADEALGFAGAAPHTAEGVVDQVTLYTCHLLHAYRALQQKASQFEDPPKGAVPADMPAGQRGNEVKTAEEAAKAAREALQALQHEREAERQQVEHKLQNVQAEVDMARQDADGAREARDQAVKRLREQEAGQADVLAEKEASIVDLQGKIEELKREVARAKQDAEEHQALAAALQQARDGQSAAEAALIASERQKASHAADMRRLGSELVAVRQQLEGEQLVAGKLRREVATVRRECAEAADEASVWKQQVELGQAKLQDVTRELKERDAAFGDMHRRLQQKDDVECTVMACLRDIQGSVVRLDDMADGLQHEGEAVVAELHVGGIQQPRVTSPRHNTAADGGGSRIDGDVRQAAQRLKSDMERAVPGLCVAVDVWRAETDKAVQKVRSEALQQAQVADALRGELEAQVRLGRDEADALQARCTALQQGIEEVEQKLAYADEQKAVAELQAVSKSEQLEDDLRGWQEKVQRLSQERDVAEERLATTTGLLSAGSTKVWQLKLRLEETAKKLQPSSEVNAEHHRSNVPLAHDTVSTISPNHSVCSSSDTDDDDSALAKSPPADAEPTKSLPEALSECWDVLDRVVRLTTSTARDLSDKQRVAFRAQSECNRLAQLLDHQQLKNERISNELAATQQRAVRSATVSASTQTTGQSPQKPIKPSGSGVGVAYVKDQPATTSQQQGHKKSRGGGGGAMSWRDGGEAPQQVTPSSLELQLQEARARTERMRKQLTQHQEELARARARCQQQEQQIAVHAAVAAEYGAAAEKAVFLRGKVQAATQRLAAVLAADKSSKHDRKSQQSEGLAGQLLDLVDGVRRKVTSLQRQLQNQASQRLSSSTTNVGGLVEPDQANQNPQGVEFTLAALVQPAELRQLATQIQQILQQGHTRVDAVAAAEVLQATENASDLRQLFVAMQTAISLIATATARKAHPTKGTVKSNSKWGLASLRVGLATSSGVQPAVPPPDIEASVAKRTTTQQSMPSIMPRTASTVSAREESLGSFPKGVKALSASLKGISTTAWESAADDATTAVNSCNTTSPSATAPVYVASRPDGNDTRRPSLLGGALFPNILQQASGQQANYVAGQQEHRDLSLRPTYGPVSGHTGVFQVGMSGSEGGMVAIGAESNGQWGDVCKATSKEQAPRSNATAMQGTASKVTLQQLVARQKQEVAAMEQPQRVFAFQ